MCVLIVLHVLNIISSEFLTHEKITDKLKDTCRKFKEDQNEWCSYSLNNELAFFMGYKNTNLCDLLVTCLRDYESDFPRSEVYVVSITPLIAKTEIDSFKIENLIAFAAEIIKHCKYTHIPTIRERYTFRFDCWKLVTDEDDKKLVSALESDTLIYIDGSPPEYDSYNHYLVFYDQNKVITHRGTPSIIITLAKDKETKQYIDIKAISDDMVIYDKSLLSLVLGKVFNYEPNLPQGLLGNQEMDLASLIIFLGDKSNQGVANKNIKIKDLVSPFQYVTDVTHVNSALANPQKWKLQIKKEYRGLEYTEILKQDILRLSKGLGNTLEILFTSFLIQNKFSNGNTVASKEAYEYEYEVLIMVLVKYKKKCWHTHAIRYPVKAYDANELMAEINQNSIYYAKTIYYHKKLGNILSNFNQIIFNDRGYDYKETLSFLNVIKPEYLSNENTIGITQEFRFNQYIEAYHDKNIQFIKNLTNKLKDNVDITLFTGFLSLYPTGLQGKSKEKVNLPHDLVFTEELDLFDYQNHKLSNFTEVLLLITIKTKGKKASTYLFKQCKNFYYAEKLRSYVKDPSFSDMANNFLESIIENIEFDESIYRKLCIENINPDWYIAYTKRQLKKIGFAISEYIKKDYVRFIEFDVEFCQKAIFFAKQKLASIDVLENIKPTKDIKVASDMMESKCKVSENKSCFKMEKEAASNFDFIKTNFDFVCNFVWFKDMINFDQHFIEKDEPFDIFFEVLKIFHYKFMVDFIGYDIFGENSYHVTFLRRIGISQEEKTGNNIYEALVATFATLEQ